MLNNQRESDLLRRKKVLVINTHLPFGPNGFEVAIS